MRNELLHPSWRRVIGDERILHLIVFIVLASLRAYGLFGPSSARMFILLNFFLMWFLPFIFFTQSGRSVMGLTKVSRPRWLFWGLLLGSTAALVTFFVGYALYGRGAENWLVSIRESWDINSTMLQLPPLQLFLIYTFPAVLFSPVGEEFFFRGMLHASIEKQSGHKAATAVNAFAFSGVHLLHHGIRWDSSGFHFSWLSGSLWFVLMMGLSWLFTLCRKRSGSIWPAVAAHAVFNLVANTTIFMFLI